MDFFGILYDMKNGKKVPYSKTYFDTLFAAKLAQLEIKTLTGTLPLTFRTSETALRSWTIYGNNTQHSYSASGTLPLTFTTQTAGAASDWSISGNDNVGKNIVSLANFVNVNTNNIVMTADKTAGTISVYTTDTPSASTQQSCDTFSVSESGNYILSGVPSTAQNDSLNCYVWDETNSQRARAWDKTSSSEAVTRKKQEAQIYLDKDCTYHVNVRVQLLYGTQTTPVIISPMVRLDGTSSDFEPYQIGVGQRTKNLLEITAETQTINNVKYTVDKEAGTITANGTASSNAVLTVGKFKGDGNTYVISGCPAGGSDNTYAIQIFNSTAGAWTAVKDFGSGAVFAPLENNLYAVRIWAKTETVCDVLIFKPMLRPSGTSADFIPYGYEIPITVNNTTQDIYIGSTPLTAGQSISKTSTGVDIAAIVGSNTITTELYNKPEMAITGVDYVGVGEPINDSWQIPLAVTCDRNLFNIYGNMAYSGGVHLINYNVETSSVTGEMSADSYYILGIANAIVKGDETFVISFDKSTAGTAELRMTKGTGSSAEIIETFDISEIKSYRIVFECEESFGNVYPRLVATEAATNTFEHIMIKKASDKGGFVPYGAKYEYNVPINAPLTEGQSVTDTVTISTFEGENVLDTTLTNKPQMTITYKGG